MVNQIIVYTTNDCIECTLVKKVLVEVGIPFEVRDVSANAEYQKEVEKLGFLGLPVAVFENHAVKGFTNELKELMELAKSKK
ncbi:glutaredoxin family protein [Neobacillus pocheonensis]|uniref:Glutaredoxin family protein n=1 Tax=Neobacillus pocheonensis TaxID=363869 RepID=A0ABT0W9L1_9BACI|nr:glutaredoxin family protein [Neobacillus pocheonensis]